MAGRRRSLGIPLSERRSLSVVGHGRFRLAAHEAAQFVGSRPTASSFLACPRKEPKKGTRGLGGLPGLRPERATRDGRSRALRPATPAWVRCADPALRAGFSIRMACGQIPLTPAPPPVGLRPKSAAPGSRINRQVYRIPPAAAPRAQCLCPRVSGTVPEILSGR